MANTVNDAINIIANLDNGIKNIAGTNHEILAILSGTNNSQNNINVIVDDLKKLLQKVGEFPEKKIIEIGDKSPNISRKNIQDILDETKNIRKSIDNLTKAITKQAEKNTTATIAKLSDKASETVAAAMIKNIEKQNKGGGLSAIVDAFNKLKDISIKDIVLGNIKLKRINKLFENAKENLKIDDKELNNIIKLINNMPEIIKSLSKVSWRINKIIKNDVIKKLNDILVGKKSLLSLSKTLQKNENTFDKANKTIKTIQKFATSLSKTMNNLFYTSLLAKSTSNGFKNILSVTNGLLSLSKDLTQNKKNVNSGVNVAKKMTTLVGNLLVMSILLSISAITGGPALLGAKLISKIVDTVTPLAKKLSKNSKHVAKAIGASITLIAFTGLMVVSSLLLTTIAMTGVPALLGAVFILGIVSINVLTFKILSKATKNILLGSISMLLMSTSLLLFGVALNKINQATKDITWGQFGMIAALTGLFGVVIAALGIPAVAPFIILGSISMAVMSASLLIFGVALNKINQATKDITWKQFGMIAALTGLFGISIAALGIPAVAPFIILGSISMAVMSVSLLIFGATLNKINQATKDMEIEQSLIVAGSIVSIGLATAAMGILIAPILLGSITLLIMSIPLISFGHALALISKSIKDINGKKIDFVCDAMDKFGDSLKGIGGPIDTPEILLGAESLKAITNSLPTFIKSLIEIKNISVQDKALNFVCDAMDKFGDSLKGIGGSMDTPEILLGVKSLKAITNSISPFINTLKNIKDNIKIDNIDSSIKSMSSIINFLKNDTLNVFQRIKARKNIALLKDMSYVMGNMSKTNSNNILSIGNAISTTLGGVNSIDISQVAAVTNMFNAFNGINKSENLLNKFTESVNKFTEACNNLMDAMGLNTDAINNINGTDSEKTTSSNTGGAYNNAKKITIDSGVNQGGIRITNVDEIAKTIAEKINGVLSVDIPDTQVQLLINGSGGNEWTISRY